MVGNGAGRVLASQPTGNRFLGQGGGCHTSAAQTTISGRGWAMRPFKWKSNSIWDLGGLATVAVWTFLPFLYSVQAEAASEHGEEFWPPIWGVSLKITDTLIVAFTFGLFVATWLLYRATRKLVLGAEETSERELRAYVSAEPKPLQKQANNSWVSELEIKNSGQTPAYAVTITVFMEVFAEPPSEQDFNVPVEETGSRISVPPGGTGRQALRRSLSEDELDQVWKGRKNLYVFGQINYRDAFNKSRYTKFRFAYDKSSPTDDIAACNVGNEAT